MSSYLTKQEKREYEQIRRKQNIQDVRDHRLMFKWLTKTHPDIVAQFCAFKAKLQRKNPLRKDLTTAPAFRKFMQKGNDVVIKRERMVVALVDVLHCPIQSQQDSSAQTTVEPVVPLNPVQSQQDLFAQTTVEPVVSLNPVQSQQDLFAQTTVEPVVSLNPVQSQQDSFTQTVAGPTVSLNENPFNLTNEEIDELLRGLDEIDYEEVRALGETDNCLPGCSEGSSVPHYIDSELASVLNMNVDDFIV